MESKKNPKSELKKDSPLYFIMALTLILLLTYIALESKIQQYPTEVISCFTGQEEFVEYIPDELIEVVPPVTVHKLPPPPPPVPIIIEESTLIECFGLKDTITTAIVCEKLDVDAIDFIETTVDEAIPISVIEDAPIFPGCEDVADKRTCFQKMMQEHIRKHFNYPDRAVAMNLQGNVLAQFTIQTDGSIGEVKMRGPHKILEAEAARILSKLPKMTPGKQRGRAVRVSFLHPHNF